MRAPFSGPSLDRRTFMHSVAGAVAGIASFSYPGLASVLSRDNAVAKPASTEAALIDPSFWSGVVIAKAEFALILKSPTRSRRVAVEPGLTIWKGEPVSIDAVNVGDSVMAKGMANADGSLAAWPGWVWVNIGRWDGVITTVGPEGMTVQRQDGTQRTIYFTRSAEVIRAKRQVPVAGGLGSLALGMDIGCVGLRLPDRSLRATRIWIY